MASESGVTTRVRKEGANVDTKRDTEPKPVYEVINKVIFDLMQRSNKHYETAVVQRETAAGTAFIPGLDFSTGDFVQIISGKYAGKCGRIIGVKYSDNRDNKSMLTYTVMFSDKEAVQLPAGRLRFLREGTPTNEGI